MTRDESFRKDPVFVAVVRDLQEKINRDGEEMRSWKDRAMLERQFLNGLRVVTVTVEIEISDDDGKESVRVCGGVW